MSRVLIPYVASIVKGQRTFKHRAFSGTVKMESGQARVDVAEMLTEAGLERGDIRTGLKERDGRLLWYSSVEIEGAYIDPSSETWWAPLTSVAQLLGLDVVRDDDQDAFVLNHAA